MSAEAFAKIMSQGAEAPEVEPTRAQERAEASPSQEEVAAPKAGEGHAKAMLRLGGHELTQALQAFPDSNIRPIEEPGVFGNENIPQRISQPAENLKQEAEQTEALPAKSVSLQDILDAPSPVTPPVQEQQNDREQGREM